jgi:glycosyltransferase involved in cell wall biosynthesis
MRLAFLTHEPFHPPSGGGSAEAIYLAQEFVRRGHDVHVFSPGFPDAENVAQKFRVQLHLFTAWQMGRYASLRNFKYLLFPAVLKRMVTRAARQTPFDLLLSQHTIAAAAAGPLRARLRVPVVMNFLDYLTGFMETWPAWLAPRPFVAALKRYELSLPRRFHTDGVLTVSDPLADLFAEAGYPRERLLPIYYGYDADLFRPAENAAPPTPPVIVMHGSFDHHHLGTIATDALREVHRQRPDAIFRFVGKKTSGLATCLEKLRATVPEKNFQTPGFVPYAEVAQHLRTATLGIVPYEESVGTHCAFVAKAVEYLGTGLPAVSTPLKNLRHYFANEPAIRFSGFDGESFACEILAVLAESPERRRALGLAASERVRVALDWRAISHRAAEFAETVQRRGLQPAPAAPMNPH